MKHFPLLLLVALVLGAAQAQQVTEEAERLIQQQVLDPLRADLPEIRFGPVRSAGLEGYFRVDVLQGGPALYIAQDGSHFFTGELYSFAGERLVNLTEEDNSAARVELLAAVPGSQKIIFSPNGEIRAVLTVFTDVTCGFCRRLHDHVEEFNALGIELQYLAFPRSGIERDGAFTREYQETSKAWCASDRQQALTLLKQGRDPQAASCDSQAVRSQYQLGREFGVTGTPAIVLPDGRLVPGYRTPEEFARMLGISGN